MTRAEAKSKGLRYYGPGRPCIRGHTGLWVTARGCCQECQRLANARPENKARRAIYERTPDGLLARRKAKVTYRTSEHGQQVEQSYKQEYRSRENELARERYQETGIRTLARTNYPRTRLNHILPEHREAVRQLYLLARWLGLVVDHIVPLKGVDVCGLHILCNLQIISHEAHRLKTREEVRALRHDRVNN